MNPSTGIVEYAAKFVLKTCDIKTKRFFHLDNQENEKVDNTVVNTYLMQYMLCKYVYQRYMEETGMALGVTNNMEFAEMVRERIYELCQSQ